MGLVFKFMASLKWLNYFKINFNSFINLINFILYKTKFNLLVSSKIFVINLCALKNYFILFFDIIINKYIINILKGFTIKSVKPLLDRKIAISGLFPKIYL